MKVKGHEIKSEGDLTIALDSMYARAKQGNEPFYNLVELMKNTETIITAIHNIKSNKGSKTVGIDKKDVNHYLQMEKGKLVETVQRYIDNYNPKPVKRVYIPKANGKTRPLGIPTMIDRIIQELARMVLDPIAEAKFFKHSYGFRPYRSCDHAIARMIDLINRNKNYFVIEGDIKSFFDNINHNKLIEIMWNLGIKDKRYLTIIKKMLKAGVMEDGIKSDSLLGTPQGGIISPLLANIYLNNFDWMVAEMFEEHPARYINVSNPRTNGVRRVRREHEPCYLVRYADDWVILCETREKAETTLTKVEKYFKHVLKLELSKEKTLITDIREQPAKFLGFEIIAEKARLKDKIVGKALPNKAKIEAKIRSIAQEIDELKRFKNDYDKAAHIELINAKIVGVSNYYKIGNCSYFFKRLDYRLDTRAYKTFTKMYGKEEAKKHRCPVSELNNRPDRHEGKNVMAYFVSVDGVKIGLTRLSFTKSTLAFNFNQEITPYTLKGRLLYQDKNGKRLRLNRPTLYNPEHLTFVALHQLVPRGKYDRLYNFEYTMNREYAFNRDKGKCKVCGIELGLTNYNCHHINPQLELDKVNKLSNLASVCTECHKLIHSDLTVNDVKMMKKLTKYRSILEKAEKSG